MRHARCDVLALAPPNARRILGHLKSFASLRRSLAAGAKNDCLLLLAGDRPRRPLAGPRIGVRALTADRQAAAMAQAPIGPEIHQPLDVHGDVTPKIALHEVVAVDYLANLQYLGVGKLVH